MYFINETDLFSVLGSLNEHFYVNNTFNFLMLQPDEYPGILLFFNQSSNPYTTKEVSNFSKKFDPKCKESFNSANEFLGLALSNYSQTYIDGNPQAIDWNYALGANTGYYGNNTIPGIRCSPVKIAHSLELWIRFDQLSIFNFLPFKRYCSVCMCRNPISSNIAVFVAMLLELS